MNRAQFFGLFSNNPLGDAALIQKAYWFSKETHRTTPNRDDGTRYFEHPRRVAVSLAEFGYQFDPNLITLALIHDTIEDTTAPLATYKALFGDEITSRLLILSKKIPKFESFSGMIIGHHKKDDNSYFHGIMQAELPVRLVKAADRLDNIRTCDVWPEERRFRYISETEEYLLPIAASADQRIYEQIRTTCKSLQGTVQ